MAMVDRVKELSKINVHDPVASHVHLLLPQRLQGSVSTASGAKPVRDIQKVRLVYRFQQHQHARRRILSSYVGIPSGRVSWGEPALGMCTRRTGGATYVPDLARSRRFWRLASRLTSYSSAVCPSTPTAPSLRVWPWAVSIHSMSM